MSSRRQFKVSQIMSCRHLHARHLSPFLRNGLDLLPSCPSSLLVLPSLYYSLLIIYSAYGKGLVRARLGGPRVIPLQLVN